MNHCSGGTVHSLAGVVKSGRVQDLMNPYVLLPGVRACLDMSICMAVCVFTMKGWMDGRPLVREVD